MPTRSSSTPQRANVGKRAGMAGNLPLAEAAPLHTQYTYIQRTTHQRATRTLAAISFAFCSLRLSLLPHRTSIQARMLVHASPIGGSFVVCLGGSQVLAGVPVRHVDLVDEHVANAGLEWGLWGRVRSRGLVLPTGLEVPGHKRSQSNRRDVVLGGSCPGGKGTPRGVCSGDA